MQKLFGELKRLLFNPVEAVTGCVESFNVWRSSRVWLRILPALPVALAVVGLLLYLTIRGTAGDHQRVITYFRAMDAEYPIGDLETVLYRDIVKLNTAVKNPAQPATIDAPATTENENEKDIQPPSRELLDKFNLTLNRVKQISPDDHDATYRLALVDALKGDMESADKAIHSLVDATGIPMFAAYHWEAINLLNKRLSGQAVVESELDRVLEKAVEWRSARPDVQATVGLRMLSQNKIDRGLDLLMSAAEKEHNRYLITARLAKNYGRERVFSKAVDAAEKDYHSRVGVTGEEAKDRIGWAESLILKDQSKQAIELLRAGINDESISKPELKQALSNVYLRQFQEGMLGKKSDQVDSQALTNLMLAIEADPMNPNLGRPSVAMLSSNAKLPEAVTKALQDMIKEQLKGNITTPDTLMILGSLYYQKKMYKEASNVWQKVIAISPNAVDALNNLAVLEFELPNPNTEVALQRIQRAYELAPNNVEVCDSYGQVLKKVNRPEDAIAKLERALRLANSNRPSTREMLAQCYADIGQKEISDAQRRLITIQNKPATASTDNSTPATPNATTQATETPAAPAPAGEKK